MDNTVINLSTIANQAVLEFEATVDTPIEVVEGGGVDSYDKLTNKPFINGWELRSGENTLTDLGIQQAIDVKVGNIEVYLKTI